MLVSSSMCLQLAKDKGEQATFLFCQYEEGKAKLVDLISPKKSTNSPLRKLTHLIVSCV